MARARTPFGFRRVFEVYEAGNGSQRGRQAWTQRHVLAYFGDIKGVEEYRKHPDRRGQSITYQSRWAIRTAGGWWLLASVQPFTLRGDAPANRYAEIDEAIRLEATPVLVQIIEGQAEVINQQGDLLDRCALVLQQYPEHRKLLGDIVHNLTEVPADATRPE